MQFVTGCCYNRGAVLADLLKVYRTAQQCQGVLRARDDSPQGFADTLDRALALTDDARMNLSEKIQAFLAGGRLWSQQARRFLEWTADTTRS